MNNKMKDSTRVNSIKDEQLLALQRKYYQRGQQKLTFVAKLELSLSRNLLKILAERRTKKLKLTLSYNYKHVGSEVHWNP
mmetsp:Transcript_32200/g.42651  ORF Transcript_32200/g.42651 Transcript_32200/m.42651 type:complete len:80 (+) Transcript_32200:53-292(+)